MLLGSFVSDADQKLPHDSLGEAFAAHRGTCGYATELTVRLLLPTTLFALRAALLQGCACVAASSLPDSTPPDSSRPDSTTPRIYVGGAAVPFETCTPRAQVHRVAPGSS